MDLYGGSVPCTCTRYIETDHIRDVHGHGSVCHLTCYRLAVKWMIIVVHIVTSTLLTSYGAGESLLNDATSLVMFQVFLDKVCMFHVLLVTHPRAWWAPSQIPRCELSTEEQQTLLY
jgi:hypothetical protein